MSSETMIRVESLGKCYHIYDKPQDRLKQSLWGGRKKFYREFWALRDVSFEVGRGETVGIIGRNGSGKSTLLQLIAGTLAPTAGTTELKGRVAALLELGSGFNLDFTGRENVYLNGAILGLSRDYIEARFGEIERFADIGDFIDQPVKTYSTGMIVRLAFSVSINVEPDVLIVDEALAVGDMAFQYKCMERLDRLTKSGVTLLFVSHDLAQVKAFCSRAIYLSHGQVRGTGAASDMAELYMMDTREEQKIALAQGSSFTAKTAIGGRNAFAFGTQQGRVVSAAFADTGTSQSAYASGERIAVNVEVEYDDTVDKPAVSLILQDSRMLNLAGRYVPVGMARKVDGMNRATMRFEFVAALNSGSYFVTIRLERRGASDTDSFPIDKQVGALLFQILGAPRPDCLGVVDMPIECEALSVP